jgi:hypothetical protein
LNTTWKIINTETGKTTKHDDTQLLINKYNGQNVAELINECFISICNNLSNSVNSKHCNSSVTDYLSFIEQTISSNYPKICNEPSTVNEIEKSLTPSKLKTPVVMTK